MNSSLNIEVVDIDFDIILVILQNIMLNKGYCGISSKSLVWSKNVKQNFTEISENAVKSSMLFSIKYFYGKLFSTLLKISMETGLRVESELQIQLSNIDK